MRARCAQAILKRGHAKRGAQKTLPTRSSSSSSFFLFTTAFANRCRRFPSAMAQDISSLSTPASPGPTAKRRRLSSVTLQNVTAAKERNARVAAQLGSQLDALDRTGSPVAFSCHGLVAHKALIAKAAPPQQQQQQSSGPCAIALTPLLAPWSVKPLKLFPPASASMSAQTTRLTLLQFSNSGHSLVAVFASGNDDGATTTGMVCIWSKEARGSGSSPSTSATPALNEGWNITATWPLSSDGILGDGVAGLHWIDAGPTSQRYVVRQPLPSPSSSAAADATTTTTTSVTNSSSTAQHMPPHLPGMNNDPNRSSNGRTSHQTFERVAVPSRGPQLVSVNGASRAEALLIVGTSGQIHLAHRGTSLDKAYPYPRTLAGVYAIKPFTLVSASMQSPCLAGVPSPNDTIQSTAADDDAISHVAFHPVVGSNKVLVAAARQDSTRVNLAEIQITNRPDLMMVTKPLSPVPLHEARWIQGAEGNEGTDANLDPTSIPAGSITNLAFTSSIHLSQPAREDITLTISASPSRMQSQAAFVTPSTLLASYGISPAASTSSFMRDAFNNLQNRKASADQQNSIHEGSGDEWKATLTSQSVVAPNRTLLHLEADATDRLIGTPSRLVTHLRAYWLDVDASRIVCETIDAGTSSAESTRPINLPVPTQPWSFSPHATFLSGATPTASSSTSTPLRATGSTPWQAYEPVDVQCHSLAASIFEATCNNESYDDVLLASSALLSVRKNRRAVLHSYAAGRGVNRVPPSAPIPPPWLVQEILYLSLRMNTSLRKGRSKAASSELKEQDHTALFIMGLLQTFNSLRSARADNGEWDVGSLPDVLPVISSLITQCEAMAREALLVTRGVKRDDSSVAFATIAHHAGLRRVLTASLQLVVDLAAWLDDVDVPTSSAITAMVQRKAKALVNDVMTHTAMRAPFANATGAGDASLASTSEPISGINVDVNVSANFMALASGVVNAGVAPPAALRDVLTLTHDALREILDSGSANIDVRLFKQRLDSFESDEKTTTTTTTTPVDALLDVLGFGSTSEDDANTASLPTSTTLTSRFVRHLFDGESADAAIFNKEGLGLFLSERDFVHSLSDVSVIHTTDGDGHGTFLGGDDNHSQRDTITHNDGISCTPTASTRRRNLVTGAITTFTAPSSRPHFPQGGPNAVIGAAAGAQSSIAQFVAAVAAGGNGTQPQTQGEQATQPCTEQAVVAEMLARPNAVRRAWGGRLRSDRWWAV